MCFILQLFFLPLLATHHILLADYLKWLLQTTNDGNQVPSLYKTTILQTAPVF